MKIRRSFLPLLLAVLTFGLVFNATAQEPKYGGSVTVAVTDDPPNLDPHITNAASARNVLHNIFATIVEMNTDFQVAPGLAESWDISDDGLTYTFHLVQNARFHDSTPVNAEALVFNFDRIKNPDTGSPRASEISFVESYEAADEYTFVAHLSQPYAAFLPALASWSGMIVSPTAVERSEEHTSELQSRPHLVCRLLLEKKKTPWPGPRGVPLGTHATTPDATPTPLCRPAALRVAPSTSRRLATAARLPRRP